MKDPVRELEIKLIEVAINERHALRNIFDRGALAQAVDANCSALAQAVDALVFGCPECNQGGKFKLAARLTRLDAKTRLGLI